MDAFTIITALITISAIISYLNNRFLKLPGTIGVIVISVILSLLITISGKVIPGTFSFINELANSFDFGKTLLDIMLGFLLFASALHFDFEKLKQQRWPVLILSTIGVVGSTFIFGLLLYGATYLLNIDLPLIYCLIFGALISPTDSVAVMSVLRKSKIPASLETIIGGESLFNDGAGILMFVILGEIAEQQTVFSLNHAFELFIHEVFGGLVLGAIIGFIAYRTMRWIFDFQTVVLASLAVVMCISVIGHLANVSIPLAIVAAGLVLGNTTLGSKTSTQLQDYLHRVWKLIDELMNTVLFVMIGLQVVRMHFIDDYWLVGGLAIAFAILARGISIMMPTLFVTSLKTKLRNIVILIWAGLRGGISVALALSLPESPYKEMIVSATYLVVLFSIIIQGLSLGKVVTIFTRSN